MNKNLLEEIKRYQSLMGLVSEQFNPMSRDPFEDENSQKYNWNGKKKGLIDLTNPYGVYAVNVGYEGQKYTLTSASEAIRTTSSGEKISTQTPPDEMKIPTFSELRFVGNSFPYPDNMVQPKFGDFPEAKKVYDTFIQNITDFLKVAPLTKMTTFTIQGTADSARPTFDIPKGYSKLDHPGDLYDGKKDPNDMNQYLADTRARELGKIIIKDVLDVTGVDISKNILYDKGISYYGQPGKRGYAFKNVTVTPSKNEVTINKPTTISKDDTTTQTSSSSVQIPKVVNTFFDLSPWGGEKEIPMKRLKNGDYVISADYIMDNKLFVKGGNGILNLWDVTGLNEQGEIKAEIKGNMFFADGLSFGGLMSTDAKESEYDYKAESTTKFVTESRPMITGIRDGNAVIRLIRFALTSRKP
jgi:hypothetical protein